MEQVDLFTYFGHVELIYNLIVVYYYLCVSKTWHWKKLWMVTINSNFFLLIYFFTLVDTAELTCVITASSEIVIRYRPVAREECKLTFPLDLSYR